MIVISGPTEVEPPPELEDVRRVETAGEMQAALLETVVDASGLFMVAAVADFRPASREAGKIRRASGMESIPVESCPDLLAGASERAPSDCVKVAFAVEIGDGGEESARRKLEEKNAQLIVLNDPSEPGAGFGVETNRVKIIDNTGEVETLPLILKTEVADEVIDRAERLLPG